jgi:hypothetical protein
MCYACMYYENWIGLYFWASFSQTHLVTLHRTDVITYKIFLLKILENTAMYIVYIVT